MDIPFKEKGFSREGYKNHYRKNDGNYNIENNPDLFNLLD